MDNYKMYVYVLTGICVFLYYTMKEHKKRDLTISDVSFYMVGGLIGPLIIAYHISSYLMDPILNRAEKLFVKIKQDPVILKKKER